MIAEQNHGAHSANIDMPLTLDGTTIGSTYMGADFLLIEPAGDHPPGIATIILEVDESRREWQVRLPEGISSQTNRVVLALVE